VTAYLGVVVLVTTAEEDLSGSVRDTAMGWLLDTSACERCAKYLGVYYASDAPDPPQRYEAAQLLFVLAAMETENPHDIREALCLVGARGVGARGKGAKGRRKAAGESRERPVTDPRHYERYGYLERMQQRLAIELQALVARPDRLQVALEANGAAADKYT